METCQSNLKLINEFALLALLIFTQSQNSHAWMNTLMHVGFVILLISNVRIIFCSRLSQRAFLMAFFIHGLFSYFLKGKGYPEIPLHLLWLTHLYLKSILICTQGYPIETYLLRIPKSSIKVEQECGRGRWSYASIGFILCVLASIYVQRA